MISTSEVNYNVYDFLKGISSDVKTHREGEKYPKVASVGENARLATFSLISVFLNMTAPFSSILGK